MLERLHDLSGATAMYHKGLALALPQATRSRPNEQALDSSAGSYVELGEAQAILATVSGQSRRNKIAHWDQAYSWYERSMGVWNEIKEPGSLSPDGFDPIPRSGRHPATGAVQACAPPPRNVLPTSCGVRSNRGAISPDGFQTADITRVRCESALLITRPAVGCQGPSRHPEQPGRIA